MSRARCRRGHGCPPQPLTPATTPPPPGGASILSRYAIRCPAGLLVDSIALSLRYAAPPATNFTPASLTVHLVNTDTKPVAQLPVATLNATSATPGAYAPPLSLAASGLRAACDTGLGVVPHGSLMVMLAVTNQDRPVVIALDDLAAGFNLSVGWAAA